VNQETKKEQNSSEKRGRWKKIAAAAAIVVFLFIAMAAQTYFITSRQSAGKEKEKEKVSTEINKFELEPFTVNLQDQNFQRYLRVQMTLEFGDKGTSKEIEEKRHRIRDKIITILQNKNVADLSTADKKAALRQELLDAINGILIKDIRGIYFQDFIIQ